MGLQAIGIDGGSEKGELCENLGATTYVDFTFSMSAVDDIRAATHDWLGPHAMLLLTEHDEPPRKAISYVRPRGLVVCLGCRHAHGLSEGLVCWKSTGQAGGMYFNFCG